jgi:cyanophycinase-like exopeptidase
MSYVMKFLTFLPFLFVSFISAQPYTSYFTGSTADVNTVTQKGICIMGGATEDDNAMRWFLNRINGGDVVVIRATGSNGYNSYLYNMSGVVQPNSVETIVIPSAAAANDPYVSTQLTNAEGIWIAGGDQYDYVEFWRNSPVETAINHVINVKNGPVGGTSAGMAVQGNAYFSAQNGTVTSNQALNNPYNNQVQIGYNDFIANDYMENVITDTHYDNPDRKGRHTAFLARLITDQGFPFTGIACEEYTAVCIDENGLAKVYGEYPNEQDYAYFIQVNCTEPNEPETCTAGQPLNWNRNNAALKVYKVPGTATGANTFSLQDWMTGSGGVWQHWFVNNGTFQAVSGTPPTNSGSLTISGPDSTCVNGTYTYSVVNPPAGTFTWTVSAQGTIVSGQGTATIQVIWNSGSVGTVSVSQ